eukprot:m.1449902 g.1449902  ORF g.1449902 m.1449902 type:complete len:77 (-) comp25115_c1_seq17:89-319(-)
MYNRVQWLHTDPNSRESIFFWILSSQLLQNVEMYGTRYVCSLQMFYFSTLTHGENSKKNDTFVPMLATCLHTPAMP